MAYLIYHLFIIWNYTMTISTVRLATILPMTLLSASLFSHQSMASEAPSFTTGVAKTTITNLVECGRRSRVSGVGTITSDDGKEWTVPAATHFATATKAADLYNECGGITLSSSKAIDLSAVPVLDAANGDAAAEEFVAYIFADNYFELSVNGQLLAVDPVPFTPFNANVVRFKAIRPVTIAVMMVDWEENLGLGSESNRGKAYHPGDGGLVAHIKNIEGNVEGNTVAITDDSWLAQTFYTSPLDTRDCLVINGNVRDSSACSEDGVNDASQFSGAHWDVPANWTAPEFDASNWPQAVTFTNDTVGVNNKKSYTNFVDIFDDKSADAQFIWSSNLVLDNLVLLRKTIK